MTDQQRPPGYSRDAMDGMDAARRAGWARAYASERASLAVILELATCMGSNLDHGMQLDNQDHMISVLRWIADHPRDWAKSLNADGLSAADLRVAAELADRAASAIAESFAIDQDQAEQRVRSAFET